MDETMDGTMKTKICSSAQQAIFELLKAAKLKPGRIVVVGCSTSEVAGKRIGTSSVMEIAQEIIQGIYPVIQENGLYLAAQCCEHLNRALIIESQVAEIMGYEEVSVVPQIKAGGAFATEVYRRFNDPVAVESLVADAGLDIGDTFIGMHLRPTLVPVRGSVTQIAQAHVTMAKSRPKLIGGKRSVYKKYL